MSTIDERVVSLKFDNKDFESNVSTSLGTLDKLKQSLNFKGASDGLDKIKEAVGKIDFSPVAESAERVGSVLGTVGRAAKGIFEPITSAVGSVIEKFDLVGTAFRRVIENMVDAAVSAGSRIISALTIDPIMQGFGEYTNQNESIRTIMSATGESLDRVKTKLGELNTYADKTIYSFSDMTSSISTFTNAGVDLDTSVNAIQGIANAAAYAGKGTREASSAMYNFSQSITAGALNLQDWRSISRYAGVGNKRMAQELINTAVAMGTLRQEGDKYVSTTTNLAGKTSEAFDATQGFEGSLQHLWATDEVILATMSKYSDATTELGQAAILAATQVRSLSGLWDTLQEGVGSSWAKTWELIIGDIDEAAVLFTGIKDAIEPIISSIGDFRNGILETWRALGGRDDVIAGFKAIWEAITQVAGVFKTALSPIIGTTESWGKVLKNVSAGFRSWAEGLKLTDDGLAAMQNLAKAVADILTVIGSVLGVIMGILGKVLGLLGGLIGVLRSLLGKILKPISAVIAAITGAIAKLVASIPKIKIALNPVIKAIQAFITPLKTLLSEIKKVGETLYKSFIGPEIGKMINNFKTFANNGIKSVANAFANAGTSIAKFTNGPLKAVVPEFKKITAQVGKFISNTKNNAKGLFDSLNIKGNATAAFTTVKSSLSSAIEAIKNTAANKGMFGVFELGLKSIGDAFEYVRKKSAELSKGSFEKIVNFFKNLSIYASQAAESIKTTFGSIKESVGGISENLGAFFSSLDPKTVFKNFTDTAVKVIGAPLYALAKIFEWFSSADVIGSLKKGVDNLGEAFNILRKDAEKLLQGPLKPLGDAFSNLATLGERAAKTFTESVVPAITEGLGTMVDQIKIFMENVDWAGLFVSFGKAIAKRIGRQGSFGQIIGDALVGTLPEVLRVLHKVGNAINAFGKKMKAEAFHEKAVALREFATALGILAISLKVISTIDPERLASSLKILAGGIAVLVGVFYALQKISSKFDTVGGEGEGGVLGQILGALGLGGKNGMKNLAKVILSTAGSIFILVMAIKRLQNVPWEDIKKGLKTVGLLMLELAGFIGLMAYLNPPKMTGIALGVLGVAGAIWILTDALKKISEIPADRLYDATYSLAVMMLMLGIALGIAGPKALLAGIGMLAASFGMGFLADALLKLTAIPYDEIIRYTGAMVGLMIGLGFALRLAGPEALLAGLGMLAAAFGFNMLIDALDRLQNITVDVNGIAQLGISFIGLGIGVAALGVGLIVLGAGLLVMTLGEAGAGVLGQVAAAMPLLGAGMKAIDSGGGVFSLMGLGVALMVMAVALMMMSFGIDGARALSIAAPAFIKLGEALKIFAKMNMLKVAGDLGGLALAFDEFVVVAGPALDAGNRIKTLGEAFKALGEGMELASNSMTKTVVVLTTITGTLATLMDQFVKALTKSSEVLNKVVAEIGEPVVKFAEDMTRMVQTLFTFAAVMVMVSSSTDSATQSIGFLVVALGLLVNGGEKSVLAFDQIGLAIKNLTPILDSLAPAAAKAMNDFTQAFKIGLQTTQSQATALLMTLLKVLVGLLTKFVPSFRQGGQSLGAAISLGIRTQMASINQAVTAVLASGSSKIRSYFSSWYLSGQYLASGLVGGLNSQQGRVAEAAARLANIAHQAMNAAAKIASPSKLFFWSGTMMGLGAAQGITSMESAVAIASEDLADAAIDGISDMISAIQDSIDDSNEIRFTPVLDSNSLSSQLASLNGSFNVYGKAMATNLVGRMPNQSDYMDEMKYSLNAQQKDMLSALNAIGNKVDELASQDQPEFALYLDSRKVASTMAKPMDRALGIRAKRGGLA